MVCFKKISISLGFFVLLNIFPVYAKPSINTHSDTYNSEIKQKIIENVPYINQYKEEIPSGCEAVSATMLINYYGYELTAQKFISDYLIKKDWYEKSRSIIYTIIYGHDIYGPDPNAAYPGNPYISTGTNCGFGSYAPATAKSMNNVLGPSKHKAIWKKGLELSEIAEKYIKNDIPVLIWATTDMKEPKPGMKWTIDYVDENSKLKKGDQFTWIAGEHCLVLIGYDDKNYYFNDPCTTKTCAYEKSIVEKRYEELGKQCVYIQELKDNKINNNDT